MRGFLLCALALGFFTEQAAAEFQYGSQSRSLGATVGFGAEYNDYKSTASVGPWSETVLTSRSDVGGGGATASGSQVSDLGTDLITMGGTLSAGSTSAQGAAASTAMQVQFTVASDTIYVSSVTTTGDELNGSNGVSFYLASGGPLINPNSSGVLSAGEYALTVSFGVVSPFNGGNSTGTYNYSLAIGSAVPEPSTACLLVIGALMARALRRGHFTGNRSSRQLAVQL